MDNVAVQETIHELQELSQLALRKKDSPTMERVKSSATVSQDWVYPEETILAIVKRTFKLCETLIRTIQRVETKVETLQGTFEEILKEEGQMDEEVEARAWEDGC